LVDSKNHIVNQATFLIKKDEIDISTQTSIQKRDVINKQLVVASVIHTLKDSFDDIHEFISDSLLDFQDKIRRVVFTIVATQESKKIFSDGGFFNNLIYRFVLKNVILLTKIVLIGDHLVGGVRVIIPQIQVHRM